MTKRKIEAAEKAHASLGASSSYRWMACPGSVALEATMPPQPSSIHAKAGTAAHALAETCLRKAALGDGNRVDTPSPHMFIGAQFEGVTVDEEMADAVAIYVDFCRDLMQKCSSHSVEKRFNLRALNPPTEMYGTADFVAYNDTGDLYVVDLKFGSGVVVETENNSQLLYYGLGAALSQEHLAEAGIQRVHISIVQPRAHHSDGAIRTFTLPFTELLGFAGDLLEAARRTMEPDAPRIPGGHCRWCKASGNCKEQMQSVQLVAQTEFANLPTHTLPAPGLLTPDQFSDILSKLHILEDWASAVRATAQAKLERGEDVPGWKLVQKRATRKWTNEGEARDILRAKEFVEEEYAVVKLKSPAQIEKLVGKRVMNVQFDHLISQESSGLNMVPATDPREEVRMSVGQEFPALPSGE